MKTVQLWFSRKPPCSFLKRLHHTTKTTKCGWSRMLIKHSRSYPQYPVPRTYHYDH